MVMSGRKVLEKIFSILLDILIVLFGFIFLVLIFSLSFFILLSAYPIK